MVSLSQYSSNFHTNSDGLSQDKESGELELRRFLVAIGFNRTGGFRLLMSVGIFV